MPKTIHGKISASTRLSIDLNERFRKFKESFGKERSMAALQVDSLELMLEIFSDKDLFEKVVGHSKTLTILKALQGKREKDKKVVTEIRLTKEEHEQFESFKKFQGYMKRKKNRIKLRIEDYARAGKKSDD